eukprot:CAMPEP_0172191698 /NCGR_PEP_ID=MMETSP1050-20130122/23870_1 /TAXON_ID=233186 /ORGANISM="Cryptomonas curvata, Strain CCAP979/52" /LENGTH=68 /DNA_ID=CAMNT_0012866825 /DNA_START=90 /DNA_END=292 /DNA_ORIENTATION=-
MATASALATTKQKGRGGGGGALHRHQGPHRYYCRRGNRAEVRELDSDFFERVDCAAAAHGVRKVEVRG